MPNLQQWFDRIFKNEVPNGEHREPDPQDNGGPAPDGPGSPGPGIAGPSPGGITFINSTGTYQGTIQSALAALGQSLGNITGQIGALQAAAQAAQQHVPHFSPGPMMWVGSSTVAPAQPTIILPPKLENGGIQVGEIIAWRWWYYDPQGYLRSITNNTLWPITEPLKASAEPNGTGAGIYAFRTEQDAINDKGGPILGRVMLWGTVIEYERGFTAQYAKIVALDRWMDTPSGLPHLRQVYGLPADGSLLNAVPVVNKSE